MSWITDNKGQVPWIAGKQPDIVGYSNNPKWTDAATNKHEPCGYWRTGSSTTEQTFYHQGNAWILKAAKYSTYNRGMLCNFNSGLYCFAWGALLKWDDVSTWVQIAPPPALYENNGHMYELMEHEGYLYAITLTVVGGAYYHIYRITVGESSWVEVAKVAADSSKYGTWKALLSFNGKMYLIASKGLYEFNVTTFAFTLKISTAEYWWFGLPYIILDDSLYLSGGGLNSTNAGILYKFDNISAVTIVAGQIASTTGGGNLLINALIEHLGSIYAFTTTSDLGHRHLLRWDGVSAWEVITTTGLPGSILPDTAVSYYDFLYGVSDSSVSSALSVYNTVNNSFSVIAPDIDIGSDNVESLVEYKDHLYIVNLGSLYEFNGWSETKYTTVPSGLILDNAVWPMPE
uniref:Uncharacterized protein n=1 Tax=viral metagenome TaxID=1070528 RepID=A0A6M3KSQ7_9ZZZZ